MPNSTLINALAVEKISHISDRKAQMLLHFLADASNELASSLDYKVTLEKLGHLIVPKLADWYVIDMVDSKGKIVVLTITHSDPGKAKSAIATRKKQGIDNNQSFGVPHVITTGKSELYKEVNEKLLRQVAR